MQRRRPQVWHLLLFLALLLAGSFPSLDVLDVDGASPEDCFADQPAIEGTGETTSSPLSVESRTSACPDAARILPCQRIAADMARVDGRLSAIVPRPHSLPVQLPHLIRRATRTDSSPADPA